MLLAVSAGIGCGCGCRKTKSSEAMVPKSAETGPTNVAATYGKEMSPAEKLEAERGALLAQYRQEFAQAKTNTSNAMTQTDIKETTWVEQKVVQKFLIRALDWKLRAASSPSERLWILTDMLDFTLDCEGMATDDLQKKAEDSLNSQVSFYYEDFQNFWQDRATMLETANTQQIETWLLPPEEASRWERISNAEGWIDGDGVKFRNGIAHYRDDKRWAPMSAYVILRFLPKDIFCQTNQIFVHVDSDTINDPNANWHQSYLLRFEKGRLLSSHESHY